MATLGAPAIPTPRALELRSLQVTINNIRERIEKIESSAVVGASIAQVNQLTTQIGDLRTQLAALATRVRLLENASTADTVSLTAAEAITQFAPVLAVGANSCEMADPSDPNRMFGIIGIALNGGSAGTAVTIQRRGPLAIPGAVFSVGRAVYASFGALTQTPNYEATAVPVGVAITTGALWLAPDWPALLDRPFASAVDDAYLRYLPITYELVKDLLNDHWNRGREYVALDATLSINTRLVEVNAVAGALSITLAASSLAGADTAVVTIHRHDTGSAIGPDPVVTIQPQSGESIDDTLSGITLANETSVTLLAAGFNGWVRA
jgi:hypothetical protein